MANAIITKKINGDEMENLPKWVKLHKDGTASFRLAVAVDAAAPRKYPTVGAALLAANFDEIKTKPDDWVAFKFRAISMAYLGESGYFMDFSSPGVLLNSLPLMLPKSKGGNRRTWLMFHKNHSEKIEARIGYLFNAVWGDAGGKQSYPGINIDVAIDWKLAQDEVRKLTSDPPLLDSVSISFTGKFEKSHPDLGWEFWDLLGHELDGEIVRIIVTEITEYYHIGLVTEGGDEEADLIETTDKTNDEITNSGSANAVYLARNNNNGGCNMEQFKLTAEQVSALATLLGATELTAESLMQSITDINAELSTAKKELTSMKARGDAFDARLKAEREAVKNLITKVEGDEGKTLHAAVDLMQFAELDEMKITYERKLDKKFTATCQNCGSTKIERRSSLEITSDDEPKQKSDEQEINAADFKVGK